MYMDDSCKSLSPLIYIQYQQFSIMCRIIPTFWECGCPIEDLPVPCTPGRNVYICSNLIWADEIMRNGTCGQCGSHTPPTSASDEDYEGEEEEDDDGAEGELVLNGAVIADDENFEDEDEDGFDDRDFGEGVCDDEEENGFGVDG
jgi:hypothetical protein